VARESYIECPRCLGTGRVNFDRACPLCDGTGRTHEDAASEYVFAYERERLEAEAE
jgi:RecJ-like exonuclease